jgi:Glycine transporter
MQQTFAKARLCRQSSIRTTGQLGLDIAAVTENASFVNTRARSSELTELVLREAVRTRLPDALLRALDLTATFVFGMEGGLAAVGGRPDFFGAMVLAFCTVVGGGIIRDMLIGAAPPESIRDWRYGTLALAGGCTSVFLYHSVQQLPLLLFADARCRRLVAVRGSRTPHPSHKRNPKVFVLLF